MYTVLIKGNFNLTVAKRIIITKPPDWGWMSVSMSTKA